VVGEHAAFGEGLRARGGDDGHAPLRGAHRERNEAIALLGRERGRLGRGAVDEDAVRAFLDLEFDERRIAIVVDGAVFEGCNERRNRAAQRGEIRVTLRHDWVSAKPKTGGN
jgi:hypothetical protein